MVVLLLSQVILLWHKNVLLLNGFIIVRPGVVVSWGYKLSCYGTLSSGPAKTVIQKYLNNCLNISVIVEDSLSLALHSVSVSSFCTSSLILFIYKVEFESVARRVCPLPYCVTFSNVICFCVVLYFVCKRPCTLWLYTTVRI